MQQRYIAFLSGIPVGRTGVSMEALRILFQRLGFLDVETYLTTGNVAFLTRPVGIVPPLEAQISRHLTKSLGVDITTFIRTPDQLAEIAEYEAFPDLTAAEAGALFVIFLAAPLSEKAAKQLRIRRSDSDLFHVRDGEIYWLRRTADAAVPPLSELIDGPATLRSLKTIAKLAGEYDGQSAKMKNARRKSALSPDADERVRF